MQHCTKVEFKVLSKYGPQNVKMYLVLLFYSMVEGIPSEM